MSSPLGRHKPNHTRRPNDWATLDECVRIAANIAEQVIAKHEADRLASRLYRRLLARLRRRS